MDDATSSPLPPPPPPSVGAAEDDVVREPKVSGPNGSDAYMALVDPFLVEALQNPRHRLTILRMELEVQKFMQNSDTQLFEFQHFPTSYLRLAAHRVAQHYGLQTLVQDNVVDGQGTRILVTKKAESKFPAICLSDIPLKQLENEKNERIKVVLKPRSGKASQEGSGALGLKQNNLKTVEERKEEYDRARARIFSDSGNLESVVTLDQLVYDGQSPGLSMYDNGGSRNSAADLEKNPSIRENSTSRVAIFRDREKDLCDPDYNRSYQRYIGNIPAAHGFNFTPFDVQKFQQPYPQHDTAIPPLSHIPRILPSFSYGSAVMGPLSHMGSNQISRDAAYMQWPNQSIIYAHSYDQLRHAFVQPPVCQQPLSFEYSQNHW